MPGGARRRLGVIFHWDGLDVVVQGDILDLERELPKPGGLERFRGRGVPFGPSLPDEGQDASNPLVMVMMLMSDDNF